MVFATMNLNEIKCIKIWLNAILGKKATLQDLNDYISNNKFNTKDEFLNTLHNDFINLPK